MSPRSSLQPLSSLLLVAVALQVGCGRNPGPVPGEKDDVHKPVVGVRGELEDQAQDATSAPPHNAAAVLQLRKGDHICLVGNALGERMQHHNHWEALLHARFPHLELVVRNLCFPGDEPCERLRSLNFGTPDHHLAHSKASVILFFFGFNESFRGRAGVPSFLADIKRLVEETKGKDYSGKGPSRMVLVSPIAFEQTGDPNLPDAAAHNEQLALYTAAMQQAAEESGAGFVDLFTPTRSLFEGSEDRLTHNGGHLNRAGYRALAPILDQALFGEQPAGRSDAFSGDGSERLRREIADKNFHWWHRYRAVNGYSIYGKRGSAGSDGTYNNTDVMERERAILDQMCANRDARIWKLARGEQVPDVVDDSNTPPFIAPKTNVGGADDRNRKAGKLGSLDYRSGKQQEQMFKLAPGYQINLVASEEQFPELANPVAINFDHRGRLWVSTMPSYPHWKPKTRLDDKLLILEDHNGDGRADECKVFAGGLHQPTGFELGYGGVFVAQQPDILMLKDTDGDDREDVRIRRIVGLDSADSHHGPAAFEWGPGGGLYFQEGTFKQSQIETIYGPQRLGDAGIWRYEPRSEKLEPHVSMAFANPWGHVFDRWGQNFIADASPGDNYWAAPVSGYVPYPDKHPGASRDKHLDWGGSKSNKSYPTFIKKRIRPSSGCEIVSSRHFPPQAQGLYLLNNVIGDLGVLQHRIREEGSGFAATEIEPLVICEDSNFRPVDLQFAPDGSLYIVDWHNALIGHLQHNLREPHRDHSHGRIWRVTHKDRPLLRPANLADASIEGLLDLLTESEDRTRYRVRRELAQRDTDDVMTAVNNWLTNRESAGSSNVTDETPTTARDRTDADDSDGDQHADRVHLDLEALWVHQTHNIVNEDLLRRLLGSPDHRARAAATRVLSYWRDRITGPHELLRACANDTHPRVRLEAVRACSYYAKDAAEDADRSSASPALQALEVALDALNYEMDESLEYALDETVRVLEQVIVGDVAELAHAHHSGHEPSANQQPKPVVFLDKGAKIVQFQLNRLPTSRLLQVDRSTGDARYKPVYDAILHRQGVARQDREEAAAALGSMDGSSAVKVLLGAIGRLNWSDNADRVVIRQLASILLSQPQPDLSSYRDTFHSETVSDNKAVRAVALAGLITVGERELAWAMAKSSAAGRIDFLASVSLVPDEAARTALREHVLACLDESQEVPVRHAAIGALALIPGKQDEAFRLVAPLVAAPQLRAAAVKALLQIPTNQRDVESAERVIETLIAYAENTAPAKRTTDPFLDAMHLADELIALLPVQRARSYRHRLGELVVRVVRLGTVHEEMRYDRAYFAVEAGRPAQLVLRNEDLMPHNLVVTAPGALRDVAMQAAAMSPTVDGQGRQYVPDSKDVLFATAMVPPQGQEVLTFTAPDQPGEYPYVCTFPNHWMRMYGVMVVVEDLDAWLASPREPVDPLGVTRGFLRRWTMDDFSDDLSAAGEIQQGDQGERLFKEATCLQCHKFQGQGGAVGPDLTEIYQRHKGDHHAVLREILDPSHRVEPQYALYNVVTVDGKVLSGIVTRQDNDSITVISNPEDPKPQVIPRKEIDAMNKSSASLMPKGLMDRYTREEILQLLGYLRGGESALPSEP